MQFFIGTSGWSYEDWQDKFYPKDLPKSHWFEYYCKYFNSVEVNATFYHSFKPSTYEKWYAQAPKQFNYVIKVPRYISHIKRLHAVKKSIQRFWHEIQPLQEKLQLVLLQLPANMHINMQGLKQAISAFPEPNKLAIEFRHASWINEEVFALLKEHQVVIVNVDSPDFTLSAAVTAPMAYLRLHGNEAWYATNYSRQQIADIAKQCKILAKQDARKIDVFFNNDYCAYAIKNALMLKKRLKA